MWLKIGLVGGIVNLLGKVSLGLFVITSNKIPNTAIIFSKHYHTSARICDITRFFFPFQFNHRFEDYKVDFCFMNHPRFGSIRCMRSFESIAKGEEIFIHYNYDTSNNNAPRSQYHTKKCLLQKAG